MIRAALLASLALPLLAAKSDPLAGRVAGKAERCIPLSATQGPQIIDDRTIAYRQSGRRLWVNHPIGPCYRLRQLNTIIIDVYSGQLCRNDRFRVLEIGSTIPGPFCRFGDFVPYDEVK